MSIAILDFGSQYSQLIARCIRETHIYCELFPFDAAPEEVLRIHPKGYILSGGPASVYESNAPKIPDFILNSSLPILGICYGMQALTQSLGGLVAAAQEREYGRAEIEVFENNPLLPATKLKVWMSHGDRIERLPTGFIPLARSRNSPIAAMGNLHLNRYGVQFHPEVKHTPSGREILQRFAIDICGLKPDWVPESMISRSIAQIRDFAGDAHALVAVSGGVDSSVAAVLAHRALGDRLSAIFVDHGLLRKNERQQVENALRKFLGSSLVTVDALDIFMSALKGVVDPEKKRRIIGELFIRTFEREALRLGDFPYLVQGTIYPDVIESRAPDSANAARIKTHHNVGGLPTDLSFKLIEPLRFLFKDEVRLVGEALDLPADLVWRQPFPGPGLAVRCLGEVTPGRISVLREADGIFIEELTLASLLGKPKDTGKQPVSQAFAVLLPVQTVGVMGDQRTYLETIALRAVITSDYMTADWANLPSKLLARISNRIVNEVRGVNRVVYDITSKPPATIEWE
jgi:GMP synthase (glutamine-hydrolysing)